MDTQLGLHGARWVAFYQHLDAIPANGSICLTNYPFVFSDDVMFVRSLVCLFRNLVACLLECIIVCVVKRVGVWLNA